MLFITSNEGKFRETQELLDVELERKEIELEEIQAIEVEDVIEHKLRQAYAILKQPLIVEDTGLFIEEWNRLPGAFTKFFIQALGREKICDMLTGDRRASGETYVGYTDGENTKVFMGRTEGKIADRPRGESGFGWDPIFIPDGHDRTFGEMSAEEKNRISMRSKAMGKLNSWLK